ncbi:hypothetical protein HZH68_017128 [Vespula germanica]|uniref:Uncharacterized protein n=1 Tax=Vespula germanica TaxID=30212 RepID=A0A834IZE1_VESGE|nr:hypothetical protein HZH68_017128 [Vespula germanica]
MSAVTQKVFSRVKSHSIDIAFSVDSKEEEFRFSKKKNINGILSSDSDSDVDKCNSYDSDFVTNAIEQTLQKLIIEKDIKDDNAEKTTIKCIKWTELYGHQKSFSFTATSSLFTNNELIDLFAKKNKET